MRKLLFTALLIAGGVAVAPAPVATAYPCGSAAHPTPTQACNDCTSNLGLQGRPDLLIGTCIDPAGSVPPQVNPNDPRCAMYHSATRHAQCIDSLMSGQPMPPLEN
ncbi:hypothetical protein MBRA_27430 [Mycobacterium branderi]|uniref:Uncharacterized protein n=1 Tax=Mycobacterium branderi TaxID=43348 RepID=A0ABN6B6V6_9MYCO|nr:hypothetical protein MBRA_27430 [Mycobacterium branderi]